MKRISFKRNFSDICQCGKCKSDNVYVVGSTRSDGTIRRRRRCLDCDYRYNTVEISVEELQRLTAKEAFIKEILEKAETLQEVNHG